VNAMVGLPFFGPHVRAAANAANTTVSTWTFGQRTGRRQPHHEEGTNHTAMSTNDHTNGITDEHMNRITNVNTNSTASTARSAS
jgi:hypothetical protein